MKKLMIAAAIVCAAVVSQAAMVRWTPNIVGVDPDSVVDNGNYAASGSALGGMAYVLTIYTEAGGSVVATKSGTLASSAAVTTISNTGIQQGTTYYWEAVLSGTQESLTSKTSDTYDYSGATLAGTVSGTVSVPSMGAGMASGGPSTWTVSGITTKEEPIPEPTSAMLMLLGAAGLALKRKQK